MKLEFKMEWIIAVAAFLVGGGVGGGVTWGLMKGKDPIIVETNKVVEKMVEVDNSLTDQDLLKIPCSSEYMEKNGEGLCREMFCRMNTRSGNQSNSATAKECEAISNTINKAYVQKHCLTLSSGDDEKNKACIEFFDRRL